MWLFDNLFLDKNTPVTINDGVDHSKDVVSSGSSRGSIKEKTPEVATASPEKKGDEFDTLFECKKQKEQAAKPKEPEKDIALEIGLPPETAASDTWASPSEAAAPGGDVSFDIGGDLSFDIGGIDTPAMPETNTTDASTVPSLDIASPDLGTMGTSAPPESDTTAPTSFVSIDAVPPSPQDIATLSSLVDAPVVSDMSNPVDSALFSLLNEDTPKNATETDPAIALVDENSTGTSEVSAVTLSPEVVPSSGDNFLSDLTSDAPSSVSPVSSHNIDVPSTQSVVEASSEWEALAPLADITTSSVVSEEAPVPVESDIFSISSIAPEVPVSSSSSTEALPGKRLKWKLGDFITELQLLDKDDQTERQKREEQIEMLEERISALRQEQDALRNEIAQMDNEKNHIKTIITTFRNQLETR